MSFDVNATLAPPPAHLRPPALPRADCYSDTLLAIPDGVPECNVWDGVTGMTFDGLIDEVRLWEECKKGGKIRSTQP